MSHFICGPIMGLRSTGTLSLECPVCAHHGAFECVFHKGEILQDVSVALLGRGNPTPVVTLTTRRCPNANCAAFISIIAENEAVLATWPAARERFDSTDIPDDIRACFEEAITCHANHCYMAAAIMVRKTLELLCKSQNATGPNLKVRIAALRSSVVLPEELLEALDHLRLLGNDAAHVDSEAFQDVGKEEIEIAIDVTREVLKGVFQFGALLSRIKSRLKPAP